jgi:hypothetical protein
MDAVVRTDGERVTAAQFAVAILANSYLTSKILSIDGGAHPR